MMRLRRGGQRRPARVPSGFAGATPTRCRRLPVDPAEAIPAEAFGASSGDAEDGSLAVPRADRARRPRRTDRGCVAAPLRGRRGRQRALVRHDALGGHRRAGGLLIVGLVRDPARASCPWSGSLRLPSRSPAGTSRTAPASPATAARSGGWGPPSTPCSTGSRPRSRTSVGARGEGPERGPAAAGSSRTRRTSCARRSPPCAATRTCTGRAAWPTARSWTRAMDRIGTESWRMAALVEDMLLLARLDQGRPSAATRSTWRARGRRRVAMPRADRAPPPGRRRDRPGVVGHRGRGPPAPGRGQPRSPTSASTRRRDAGRDRAARR